MPRMVGVIAWVSINGLIIVALLVSHLRREMKK